jgi:hypothetical protein
MQNPRHTQTPNLLSMSRKFNPSNQNPLFSGAVLREELAGAFLRQEILLRNIAMCNSFDVRFRFSWLHRES